MENINLEFYKVFCCVAKNENITKASEELLISQPAITQSIKKLEEQIEHKLFYRTKQGMKLTKEGEELYQSIKNAIDCLNQSKKRLQELQNSEASIIRIGGGTTLLKHNVTKYLKVFKKRYPNIKIEITHTLTSELFPMLENDLLDIVLYTMPHTLNESLIGIPIEIAQDCFVAESTSFHFLKNKKINLQDLNQLPLILQSNKSASRQYLDFHCKKNKVTLTSSCELASYGLVLDFVKAGLGLGFININNIEEEIKNGELFIIDLNYKFPKRNIGVAIHKKHIANQTIQNFIDTIKK